MTLKLKTYRFEQKTRVKQLSSYIDNAKDIEFYALQILKEMLPMRPLRLMGIKLSKLIDREEYEKTTIEKFLIKKTVSTKDQIDALQN